MSGTELDDAYDAMTSEPESIGKRLRFFDRLVHSELFVLVEGEVRDGRFEPQVLEPSDGPVILAFDREERLAAISGVAPYAALSGRALVSTLAGRSLGICLNLGCASETVLGAEEVAWLASIATAPAEIAEATPVSIAPPQGISEGLIEALSEKLATAQGLGERAHLVAAEFSDGSSGFLMVFVGTVSGAEPALAQAVGEAIAFSGQDIASLSVAFPGAGDRVALAAERHGLTFDLPIPVVAEGPTAPGTDPDRPPNLR